MYYFPLFTFDDTNFLLSCRHYFSPQESSWFDDNTTPEDVDNLFDAYSQSTSTPTTSNCSLTPSVQATPTQPQFSADDNDHSSQPKEARERDTDIEQKPVLTCSSQLSETSTPTSSTCSVTPSVQATPTHPQFSADDNDHSSQPKEAKERDTDIEQKPVLACSSQLSEEEKN